MASGKKYDDGKTRYDLIPAYALEMWAKVLTFGAIKYADRNWEKGIKWGRVFGALMRHAWAFWRGEELDPESGLPHLAHLMCCASFLLEFMRTGRKFDDRPTTTKEVVTAYENRPK